MIRAGAELVGLALSAFVAIWLSRSVGADGLGYFAVVQTIMRFGGTITSAGLPTVASQRVANDTETPQQAWPIVSVSRLALSIMVVVLMLVVSAYASFGDPNLRQLIQLSIPALLCLAVSSEWLLVASGRVLAVSISRVLASASGAAVAFLLVRSEDDLPLLAAVVVVPIIVATVTTVLVTIGGVLDLRRLELPTWARAMSYRPDAWDYLKADLSVLTYNNIDRLFLYVFASPAVVGLYEAAYKLIQPFYAIGVVVHDSMFVKLARAVRAPGPEMAATLRTFSDLMFLGTVPLGFLLTLFAPTVVEFVYPPAFAQSSVYLALLGWAITFGYLATAVTIPLMAWSRPKEYSRALLAGSGANLAGNVLLIPSLLGIGAAVATIVAKLSVASVGFVGFRRVVNYPILADFGLYCGMSSAALAAGVISLSVFGLPSLAAALLFVATYCALAVSVRWHRYLRPLRHSSPTLSR